MNHSDGWCFRKMQRREINADPVQGEFFTPEGLADGLVREMIQNALDAAAGGDPVRIRFSFSDAAVPGEVADVYQTGLLEHLEPSQVARPARAESQ